MDIVLEEPETCRGCREGSSALRAQAHNRQCVVMGLGGSIGLVAVDGNGRQGLMPFVISACVAVLLGNAWVAFVGSTSAARQQVP
jgi:hypothetical protein